MPSLDPFSLAILFLSMISFTSVTTQVASQNYLFHVCANTTFTPSTNYLSTLSSLLSSLSFYPARNVQFYGLNSGIAPPSSNASSKIQISVPAIHALFLCRGDVSAKTCSGCVAAAAVKLFSECSRERAAIIWYDECSLRYSNESIFNTLAVSPRFGLLNTQNITEQDRFIRLVNTTLTDLGSQVSDVPTSAKKFGTKEVKFNEFQTVYILAQCTPDLSSADCHSCIQAAISRLSICCSGRQGGRYYFPSCSVHYELYPFYSIEATAPTPTPVTPGSETRPQGKSNIYTVTTIAVVAAPIAVSLVLFLVV